METKCSVLNGLILRCLVNYDEQLDLRRQAGARDKHAGSSAHKCYLSDRSKCNCLESECRSRERDA